jgi:hypothetical protein
VPICQIHFWKFRKDLADANFLQGHDHHYTKVTTAMVAAEDA